MEKAGTEVVEQTGMTPGKKVFFIIFLLVLMVFAGIGVKWVRYRFTHAITDNAFVEADMVNVAPLVSGRIKKIHVREGDRVEKGDLLVEIDPADYENQVALQEANVEGAKHRLDRSLAGLMSLRISSREAIRKAKSALAAAEAKRDRVSGDYERIRGLLKSGAVARSRFDAMKAAFIAARSGVTAAAADLERARAGRYQVKEAESGVAAARSALRAAREALQVARTHLGYTRIVSPVTGVVAKKFLYEGDFLAAGYPVLSVYDRKGIYVTANLEETKTRGVRVGQEVDLDVDAYPGKDFRGRVILVGEASGAKFALIPRDNSAGEFTKVVQRIPVRIAVGKGINLLKPGMSVTVGISLRDHDLSAAGSGE